MDVRLCYYKVFVWPKRIQAVFKWIDAGSMVTWPIVHSVLISSPSVFRQNHLEDHHRSSSQISMNKSFCSYHRKDFDLPSSSSCNGQRPMQPFTKRMKSLAPLEDDNPVSASPVELNLIILMVRILPVDKKCAGWFHLCESQH